MAEQHAGERQAEPKRLAREKKTVAKMIEIFCRGHHQTSDGLCPECADLQSYALCRLDRCPFGEKKSACNDCPIHCYRPEMRQRIRDVMRYAGPRMLLRHPVLAIRHQLDSAKRLAEDAPAESDSPRGIEE